MVKSKLQRRLLVIIPILIIAGLISYYITVKAHTGNLPVNHALLEGMAERDANAWNHKEIDSCIHLLHSGDLVVRTGIDVTSYALSRLNRYDKTYSHCGLVIVEHGYPFVYHSIGGEDNPNECLRRDSASFFFSPRNNFGFGIARYDLTAPQVIKLEDTVRKFYKEKIKFDLDFDLKTDDKFYCAEFVYKSLIRATGDKHYIKTLSLFGHPFVGVDNLYLTPHARMICQVRFK